MLPLFPMPAPTVAGWSPLMWLAAVVAPALVVALVLTRLLGDADQATAWTGPGKPPLRLRIQRWLLIGTMVALAGAVIFVVVRMILQMGKM